MPNLRGQPPEFVPLLAWGKHRNPRKGACFMELASYLAGERWSDHPACTHPLLAAVARMVNDQTSDAGRSRLVVLIPSVIGLTSDDLHVDARIALRCATMALPIAVEERQRILAVGVLACDRVLADLDGRPPSHLEPQSCAALATAPRAARWARDFTHRSRTSAKVFRHEDAPLIARHAVVGITHGYTCEPDTLLHDLLVGAIDDCTTWTDAAAGRCTVWDSHIDRRMSADRSPDWCVNAVAHPAGDQSDSPRTHVGPVRRRHHPHRTARRLF